MAAIAIDSRQDDGSASASPRMLRPRYRGFRSRPFTNYIRYDQGGEELYDLLARDPNEMNNRAGAPAYSGVLAWDAGPPETGSPNRGRCLLAPCRSRPAVADLVGQPAEPVEFRAVSTFPPAEADRPVVPKAWSRVAVLSNPSRGTVVISTSLPGGSAGQHPPLGDPGVTVPAHQTWLPSPSRSLLTATGWSAPARAA